jgi:hypothetical protein
MESALYFLTLGEGRLKDARKEFQEVLRYDKNNKSAKEYLSRLKERRTLPESSIKKSGSRFKIRFKHAVAGVITIAVLLTAILIIPRGGPGPADDHQPKIKGETQGDSEVNVEKGGTSDDIGQRPTGSSGDNSESKSSGNSNIDGKDKTSRPTTGRTKKKPVARAGKSAYNYPNQNLKEHGFLTVKTNVRAEIYVDLEKYGATNGPSIKLAPGRHFIEIRAEGYRRMTRRIFSEKDKTVDLRIDLLPER